MCCVVGSVEGVLAGGTPGHLHLILWAAPVQKRCSGPAAAPGGALLLQSFGTGEFLRMQQQRHIRGSTIISDQISKISRCSQKNARLNAMWESRKSYTFTPEKYSPAEKHSLLKNIHPWKIFTPQKYSPRKYSPLKNIRLWKIFTPKKYSPLKNIHPWKTFTPEKYAYNWVFVVTRRQPI